MIGVCRIAGRVETGDSDASDITRVCCTRCEGCFSAAAAELGLTGSKKGGAGRDVVLSTSTHSGARAAPPYRTHSHGEEDDDEEEEEPAAGGERSRDVKSDETAKVVSIHSLALVGREADVET